MGDKGESQMLKRIWLFLSLILVSVVLLTACESSYTVTGSSERSRITNRSGWLEKSIKKANGSATQEIEVDWSGRRLEATVTLEVSEGTFGIELLDGEGNVTLSLEASAGRLASGRGYMETDTFGDAKYRVTAAEARDVKYRIEFTIE